MGKDKLYIPPRLRKFTGRCGINKAKEWLSGVNKLASQLLNEDDIIKEHLSDLIAFDSPMFDWVMDSECYCCNWQDFQILFRAQFCGEKWKAQRFFFNQFMNTKQQPQELLSSFIDRMSEKAERLVHKLPQ